MKATFSIRVKNACEWLKGYQAAPKWLATREDALHEAIQYSLNMPQFFHCGVDLLLQAFPYFGLVLSHTARWSPLLMDALVGALDLRDNAMIVRILTQMGDDYMAHSKPSAARDAFTQALERTQMEQTDEHLLAAYIGLIRLQALNPDDTFHPLLVEHTLALARQVGIPEFTASAYQAVALAYTHRKETRPALGYGQMAYVAWHHLGNELEMARTAFTLASACRAAERHDQAGRYLEFAEAQFLQTEYAQQYGVLAYEIGASYFERNKYEIACQWLSKAAEEFREYNRPYYIAASHHALGLAYRKLHNYAKAKFHLTTALEMWQRIGNRYEEANAYFGLGYAELSQGNKAEARSLFQQALDVCYQIPAMNSRQELERDILEGMSRL
jgi:tetratricopeptide (TPR) repeat protein